MKRFFRKRVRFFWSWGLLKFVLWTVTLIILFYAEEDWRGARAWAAMKAKWEARGETLDIGRLIPPTVPADQNLAAIPLFRLERASTNGQTEWWAVALQKAIGSLSGNLDIPATNGWIWNETSDVGEIRTDILSKYVALFKSAPPSSDPLDQLDALFPFMAPLREAATARPYCRFPFDLSQEFPAARSAPLVMGQIKICRILSLHAVLALHDHQPDLVIADLDTILKLASGAEGDPGMFGGSVGVAMFSIGNASVYDGLALHAWDDAQLAHIEELLKPIDFLAAYQFALRGDAAGIIGSIDYIKNVRRSYLSLLPPMSLEPTSPPRTLLCSLLLKVYSFQDSKLTSSSYSLWPGGWFDHNKACLIEAVIREMGSVDDHQHRVYPAVGNELEQEGQRNQRSAAGVVPWNTLCTSFSPGQLRESSQFALAQVRVDETRIACALERYHLAHRAYPPALENLVPDEIAELPHDVMNGQPYHYRLRGDGTFLLYSVGWNQTDDGGITVREPGKPGDGGHPQIEHDQGDWAWPTPKQVQNP